MSTAAPTPIRCTVLAWDGDRHRGTVTARDERRVAVSLYVPARIEGECLLGVMIDGREQLLRVEIVSCEGCEITAVLLGEI